MRKIMRIFLLLVLATVMYEIAPRMLPIPTNPHSFDGREVLFLQNHLSSRYVDITMVVIYSLGYIIVIYGTAIYIALKWDVQQLEKYLAVFILVQSMAVFTWWRFPVSPPRMAVEGVRDIRRSIFSLSESFNPFPHGAFPSLHVANALSGVLFIRRYGRKILSLWLIIFLMLMFSTVYLGEHYWQDIVGGIGYSLASYLIVIYLSRHDLRKKIFGQGESDEA